MVATTPREQAEKSGGRWAKVLFVGGPRHGMVQLMSLDQSYVDVPRLPIDWEGSELRCDTYFRREMTTGFRNLVWVMSTPPNEEPTLDRVLDALALAAGVARPT